MRQWGTYYAGTGTGNRVDKIHRLLVDPNGDIIIMGSTSSTLGISTTGAFQTVLSYDPATFLAKLNGTGSARQWGTYYTGSGSPGQTGTYSQDICMDAIGNFYVAGGISNNANFATPGAHQTAYGGSYVDGFISKFNNNGLRLWATYYGGAGAEVIEAMDLDSLGNINVTGGTNSTNNISSPDALQLTLAGTYDSFIGRFDTSGTFLWGSYYGGAGHEQGHALCSDAEGNIFLGGESTSSVNITTAAAHQTVFAGVIRDAMLIKFAGAKPIPPVSSAPSLTVCSGVKVNLTATGSGVLNWYSSLGSTQALGTGTLYTTPTLTTASSTTTYSFFVETKKCSVASDRLIIKVRVNTCTDIESHSTERQLKLYPNPNSGQFVLEFQKDAYISIFNTIGQCIRSGNLKDSKNLIDLSSHPAGIYIVHLQQTDNTYFIKVIIE